MRGPRRARWLLTALGLALGALVSSREGRADPPEGTVRLDLAECLARAERSYPGLVAARHKILASDAQLDEAWAAPFFPVSVSGFMSLAPTARGNSTYSPDVFAQNPLAVETGYIARLTADTGIPISPWSWIRLGHVRDAARAGLRASRGEEIRARLELRANVRKAFFGLQSARDALYLVERAEGYVRTAREQLATAEAQDGGPVSVGDQVQLNAAADELILQRTQAERAERSARAALGMLTGVGPDVDVPDAPLCPYRTDLGPLTRHLTRARLNRPEVDMLQAGIAARRAAVDIQWWAFFPDLALGMTAAYSTSPTIAEQPNPFSAGNANFGYWGAGLALRWTFDPVINHFRVRRLTQELLMTEAQQRLALGGIALEVTDAYGVALEKQQAEAVRGRQERETYRWFTEQFQQFQSGATEVSTLLPPLRQYLTYQAQHIQAINELNTSLAVLALVTGQPEMEGAPDHDCTALPPPDEASDAAVGEDDAAVSDDEVEALLRGAQTPPAPVDAGARAVGGGDAGARPAGRDGGIARPR